MMKSSRIYSFFFAYLLGWKVAIIQSRLCSFKEANISAGFNPGISNLYVTMIGAQGMYSIYPQATPQFCPNCTCPAVFSSCLDLNVSDYSPRCELNANGMLLFYSGPLVFVVSLCTFVVCIVYAAIASRKGAFGNLLKKTGMEEKVSVGKKPSLETLEDLPRFSDCVYCRKSRIDSDSRFCSECGASLDASQCNTFEDSEMIDLNRLLGAPYGVTMQTHFIKLEDLSPMKIRAIYYFTTFCFFSMVVVCTLIQMSSTAYEQTISREQMKSFSFSSSFVERPSTSIRKFGFTEVFNTSTFEFIGSTNVSHVSLSDRHLSNIDPFLSNWLRNIYNISLIFNWKKINGVALLQDYVTRIHSSRTAGNKSFVTLHSYKKNEGHFQFNEFHGFGNPSIQYSIDVQVVGTIRLIEEIRFHRLLQDQDMVFSCNESDFPCTEFCHAPSMECIEEKTPLSELLKYSNNVSAVVRDFRVSKPNESEAPLINTIVVIFLVGFVFLVRYILAFREVKYKWDNWLLERRHVGILLFFSLIQLFQWDFVGSLNQLTDSVFLKISSNSFGWEVLVSTGKCGVRVMMIILVSGLKEKSRNPSWQFYLPKVIFGFIFLSVMILDRWILLQSPLSLEVGLVFPSVLDTLVFIGTHGLHLLIQVISVFYYITTLYKTGAYLNKIPYLVSRFQQLSFNMISALSIWIVASQCIEIAASFADPPRSMNPLEYIPHRFLTSRVDSLLVSLSVVSFISLYVIILAFLFEVPKCVAVRRKLVYREHEALAKPQSHGNGVNRNSEEGNHHPLDVTLCLETTIIMYNFSHQVYLGPPGDPLNEEGDVDETRILQMGYQVVEYIYEHYHDAYLFIAKSKLMNRVVVAFRGTSSIRNLKVDLRIQKAKIRIDEEGAVTECKIHTGFWEAYQSVRERMLHVLYEILADCPLNTEIYLTGHSLGGALATIAALDISLDISFQGRVHLLNFGSPKVGDAAFAKICSDRLASAFRIVCDGDIIVQYPFMLRPFKHIGIPVVISDIGNLIIDPSFVEQNWINKVQRQISSHLLLSYRASLVSLTHYQPVEDLTYQSQRLYGSNGWLSPQYRERQLSLFRMDEYVGDDQGFTSYKKYDNPLSRGTTTTTTFSNGMDENGGIGAADSHVTQRSSLAREGQFIGHRSSSISESILSQFLLENVDPVGSFPSYTSPDTISSDTIDWECLRSVILDKL